MSDKPSSQEPAHQHEGFFERILHHHNQNEDAKYQKEPDQDKAHKDDHDHDHDAHKKKESELDKMKDYLHEDEELEQEGRTYGGLM
ncbi:hypothetical protein PENSUB_5478 [Penicillium subrubescens]|uniref:Uncharacterized protein n=2 Tax=Penicillium subrubescens TaxID=1316194 RepID=A0A1Q5UQY6_9EURO|nr:hypothetical protein PENSUB_5478 [Penicillium subrubescens]